MVLECQRQRARIHLENPKNCFLAAQSGKKHPRFLCRVPGRKIDLVSFDSRCVFGWIEGCVLQRGRAGVFTVGISEDWTHTHTPCCVLREKRTVGSIHRQVFVSWSGRSGFSLLC